MSSREPVHIQIGDKIAERFINNVVHLTVKLADGEMDGFGFVVGELRNKLYVVTANHVVHSDKPDMETKEVLVKFYDDEAGEPIPAELLDIASSRLDAALLRVSKPEWYRWERKVLSSDYRKGDKVWFIGQSRKWIVPTDDYAGNLQNNEPGWDGQITFYITSVKPGTSGAPLFTENGIIGMITTDNYLEARAC